jgi:putative endonuclease
LTVQSTYKRKLGDSGEDVAVSYLKARGYVILERNFRALRGEIDIIARDQDTLVFIEVKTASSRKFGSPETWVGRRKQLQIGKIAGLYLAREKKFDVNCRFDVISILITARNHHIQHFKDAFWL